MGPKSYSYTGRLLPYGITQCYLPPDTSERAPPVWVSGAIASIALAYIDL